MTQLADLAPVLLPLEALPAEELADHAPKDRPGHVQRQEQERGTGGDLYRTHSATAVHGDILRQKAAVDKPAGPAPKGRRMRVQDAPCGFSCTLTHARPAACLLARHTRATGHMGEQGGGAQDVYFGYHTRPRYRLYTSFAPPIDVASRCCYN